jgi:hypothetical protein
MSAREQQRERQAAEPKRRGRPSKPGRRGNLTIRIRDTVRGKLKAAAARHQRSLSEEAEARIEGSFVLERDPIWRLGEMQKLSGEAAALAARLRAATPHGGGYYLRELTQFAELLAQLTAEIAGPATGGGK